MNIEEAAKQFTEAVGSNDDKQAMVAVVGVIVAAVKPLERIADALEGIEVSLLDREEY